MISEIRQQLESIVAGKSGTEALDALLTSDLIKLHKARDMAIRVDFFALYGKSTRTARDIEEDLAVKYNVARDTVYSARNRGL